MSEENSGKKVLVTGASGGIGAAIALAAAKEGYYVVAHYNHGKEKAEAVLEQIKAAGGSGELIQFNLSDRADHKPAELSGGEKQRIAVARALVNKPAVVLADEPSGSLDSANKAELHSLFFDLRDSLGQTFVIVTHDEGLAAQTDRTIHLRDGLVVSQSAGAPSPEPLTSPLPEPEVPSLEDTDAPMPEPPAAEPLPDLAPEPETPSPTDTAKTYLA